MRPKGSSSSTCRDPGTVAGPSINASPRVPAGQALRSTGGSGAGEGAGTFRLHAPSPNMIPRSTIIQQRGFIMSESYRFPYTFPAPARALPCAGCGLTAGPCPAKHQQPYG